ncbi:Rieske (2Fe-2S) protein [Halocatena salina]|uniref:Rieske (2Fe-2S) protein n=1 Tax=Halocatena salina TaxID=2934340 RepID=A0A8U0A7N5_9EURY|nr:Rieske (2Fe-2S) protein [Halocatena salina]UPM44023.1 Rieske (2Fe-2S) protein [Halocatena salina]
MYLDPDPERTVSESIYWRNRLADGLQENLPLVMAKAVIGLDAENEGFYTPIETAVNFGTNYRDMGWGSGLTVLAAMANVYDDLSVADRTRALYTGVRYVADDCADEPPRFSQYQFANRSLGYDRLKSWFRETCEVRDTDGAERCLLTAVENLAPPQVAGILAAAATDHLYMNTGHTLDFINKAFEMVDHLGWEHADSILAATVQQITDASRSEERSAWRQPIDVAQLCFDADDRLSELVAAGEGRTWERPAGFIETLLGDDPHAITEALTDAIRTGATHEQLAHAVTTAAARRIVQFSTSNEFSDWNTVHHTFSYANAVHGMARRTDAIEVYRGCIDAAMSVYLDRFLNTPPAPIPEPVASDRDPAEIRETLLETFDEQGEVDRATRLVNEHFDAGGDPAALKRTLGTGLLGEDANFHTLQNVEAAFAQFDRADCDGDRRVALMATARYMAAHFPTRREAEQTYTIADRLHRGESIHTSTAE